MNKGHQETISIRIVSSAFMVLAIAIFKPFGLEVWQWQAYVHLLALFFLGVFSCLLTEVILKYIVRMPRSYDRGVSYIISRNLRFQCINTPLVALLICLYRHFAMSDVVEGNRLSLGNFLETLVIIAFLSFAIGLYWRFKFRSRYLTVELEETRLMNEQLKILQANLFSSKDVGTTMDRAGLQSLEASPTTAGAALQSLEASPTTGGAALQSLEASPTTVGAGLQSLEASPTTSLTLTGSTNEYVSLEISNLLYIEAVGNYVKVCQLQDNEVHTSMLRATMKQMEDTLQTYPMIVRCHRAFMVNLGQVEQISSNSRAMQLVMRHTHDAIPVSRSNVNKLKELLR